MLTGNGGNPSRRLTDCTHVKQALQCAVGAVLEQQRVIVKPDNVMPELDYKVTVDACLHELHLLSWILVIALVLLSERSIRCKRKKD
jgi:hypothetical protein